MYNLATSENSTESRHNLIVSTPMGQQYDLIALRMAVAANFYGWNAIYLGTDLAPEEIAYASQQTQSYPKTSDSRRKNWDVYPSEASHVACPYANCEELDLMPSHLETSDNTPHCRIGAIPET